MQFMSFTGQLYTFFSSVHGICYRINHMMGHKTNLRKFKIKIILSMSLDHNGIGN